MDKTTDFDTDSSAASGSFYGWDSGRAAPAEVGGRIRLVGNDPANFANLLFLGNIVMPQPLQTTLVALTRRETEIKGYAIREEENFSLTEEQTIERVTSKWESPGGITEVFSFSTIGSDRVLDSTGGTSNLLLTADFDVDSGTSETSMTEGYDYFLAFEGDAQLREGGSYRGFHGLEFNGIWPTMGTARYRGRFLVIDYRNNYEIAGRPLDDIVMIKRVPGPDGRPETRVEVNIPADRLPSPVYNNNYVSRGTDLSFSFTYTDTGDTSAKALSITQSESETLRGLASASFYGYDPDVLGLALGGPDEVAIAAHIRFDRMTPAFSVLVAAD